MAQARAHTHAVFSRETTYRMNVAIKTSGLQRQDPRRTWTRPSLEDREAVKAPSSPNTSIALAFA